MRLSELQKLRAFDAVHKPLDHVQDVRLERRNGEWEVTDLLIGRGVIAERLGFVHGVVDQPAILARLARRLVRRSWVVRWDQVTIRDGELQVEVEADALPGVRDQQ